MIFSKRALQGRVYLSRSSSYQTPELSLHQHLQLCIYLFVAPWALAALTAHTTWRLAHTLPEQQVPRQTGPGGKREVIFTLQPLFYGLNLTNPVCSQNASCRTILCLRPPRFAASFLPHFFHTLGCFCFSPATFPSWLQFSPCLPSYP